jgi:hypothetical protein
MNAKENNINFFGAVAMIAGLAGLAFGAVQLKTLTGDLRLSDLNGHLKLLKHITISDGKSATIGVFSTDRIFQKKISVDDQTTNDPKTSKANISGQILTDNKTLTNRNKKETICGGEVLVKYMPSQKNSHKRKR